MKNLKAYNQNFFNSIASTFDLHVRQSIPLFNDFIENVIENLTSDKNKNSSILDICGSTGNLGRLLNNSGFNGNYTCLDASPEMQKQFNEKNTAKNLKFDLAAFGSNGWNDNGIEIKAFDSKNKHFDFSLEILGFQFYTKDRLTQIREMKKNSNNCIFFEKFTGDNWQKNESLKNNLWKSKSFTSEQIKDKQTTVLNAMGDYLHDSKEFEAILKAEFLHVQKIANLGNFKGYFCSNNLMIWNTNKDLLNNIFNA